MSCPVQRESGEVKLRAAELMIEMQELYAKEERQRQLQEQRKGSVLKVRRMRICHILYILLARFH